MKAPCCRFPCPICGSHEAEILNGSEVLLTNIDFD